MPRSLIEEDGCLREQATLEQPGHKGAATSDHTEKAQSHGHPKEALEPRQRGLQPHWETSLAGLMSASVVVVSKRRGPTGGQDTAFEEVGLF